MSTPQARTQMQHVEAAEVAHRASIASSIAASDANDIGGTATAAPSRSSPRASARADGRPRRRDQHAATGQWESIRRHGTHRRQEAPAVVVHHALRLLGR
jgi:hypothetical protein